ncbi:uncharacterized protein LOC130931627 [Corythoichthys intestinalis]|uniref:uncharacterized protein LOC130931627 n=1 Tax=Corythoichthys intestinalis TaxID=161448 RepID=UPI0025A57D9D|nr:uncharacterized protein LOC130931627 [Corythoichthys intestinalis]
MPAREYAMETIGQQRGSCDAATVHVKSEEGGEKQSALILDRQGSPAPCNELACGGGRGLDLTADELGGPSVLHVGSTTPTEVQLSTVMPSAPPLGSDFSSKAVLCLIDAVGRRWGLYETRERSQLFQSVQEELAAKGHFLPVERIRRKWNNLIVTYKRVKDRSRETGHAKTSWEFFDLMDATLCDTVGSYISSNKRSKGGGASIAQASAKVPARLHVPPPTNVVRPNGNLHTSVQVESGVKGQTSASSSTTGAITSMSAIRQTESPDLKPLIVLNSDIVTANLHLSSTDPPQSFISSPRFTQIASPSLVSTVNTDLNTSRKAPSFPTDVICFRRSNNHNLASNFPSTCSSLSASVSTPAMTGPEAHKGNEDQSGSSFYQEILKRRKEQIDLDGVAHGQKEARERRRERREVRMDKSLCRIATALELLSSKQDTVIALLQRIAERK